MQRAINEFQVKGIRTTIPLHQHILADDYFRTGNIDTQFIRNRLPAYEQSPNRA